MLILCSSTLAINFYWEKCRIGILTSAQLRGGWKQKSPRNSTQRLVWLRQESNLHLRFRKSSFYLLSYGASIERKLMEIFGLAHPTIYCFPKLPIPLQSLIVAIYCTLHCTLLLILSFYQFLTFLIH